MIQLVTDTIKKKTDKDSDEIDKKHGDAGRCTKISTKRVCSCKRKFHGNQHSKNKNKQQRKSAVTDEAGKATISGKKIADISVPKHNEDFHGYRLIEITILDGLVRRLLCPNCQDFGLNVYEDDSKRRGIMSSFIFLSNVEIVIIMMKVIHLKQCNMLQPLREEIHMISTSVLYMP